MNKIKEKLTTVGQRTFVTGYWTVVSGSANFGFFF